MTYTERLHVPLRWWVQGTMLVATFWLATAVAMPVVWSLTVTAVMLAIMVGTFLRYGAARVAVSDTEFLAGPARIALQHVGEVTALDAEETWLVSGRDADPRAFLVLRPYLKRSVKVEILDPADPTPYWLVNTRHAGDLAAALTASRTPRPGVGS